MVKIIGIQGISYPGKAMLAKSLLFLSFCYMNLINADSCQQTVFPLVQLEPSEYEIASPLFQDFPINEPILHLVLENKGAGIVLTNNKTNPNFALVYNPSSFTFLAGTLDQADLQNVITYLQTLPKVNLVCPLNWNYQQAFEKEGFIVVERIQLKIPDTLEWVDVDESPLPAHFKLAPIEEKNFNRCNWYSFILKFYNDEEQFFNEALGVCITDDKGLIISESYGLLSEGKAEIGVITHENYRGKNYGTIVCGYMVNYCYMLGLQPIWSCNVINPASAAVAKKLGFVEDCRYLFLKWPRS